MGKHKYVWLLMIISSLLWATENNGTIRLTDEDNKDSVGYRCNVVFENRKGELLTILDSIDEEKQKLETANQATKNILDRKANSLNKKEDFLTEKEKKVNVKLARLQALVEKNQQILKQIQEVLRNKVTEAYAKMGASKAANILNAMDFEKAAGILFNLDPKAMSNILAKMEAQKASEVTLIIKRGPPFKTDINKFAIKKSREYRKSFKRGLSIALIKPILY